MRGFFHLTVLTILFACSGSDDPKPENIITPDEVLNKQEGKYYEIAVSPESTDPSISSSGNSHYAYRDTRVESNHRLLVFLGGTRSAPSQYHKFCRTAADLGYHVINIDYPNSIPGTICREETSDCYVRYHSEMWFGENMSDRIDIDENNSLINRIVSLLKHLDVADPTLGWSEFLQDGDLDWTKLFISGHSQGGGHAIFIGYEMKVARIISFAAPNDFNINTHHAATWLSNTPATSLTNFYIMEHSSDEIVSPEEQYQILKDMDLLTLGDTVYVSGESEFTTHALITNLSPNPAAETGRLKHNSMIVDAVIPAGEHEAAVIINAWKYLLRN